MRMRGDPITFKMATATKQAGQSPTSLSKTIERVFEDAQYTGEIHLSSRKLKEYPKAASKYDLVDTTAVDLSKNRLSELPSPVCDMESLERIEAYHNIIRALPEALVQLQCLVHLNLSRNQLSTIPVFLCQLQNLEVLHATNNKLVSLPEEIGKLENLMDLDVSCNDITHLPTQISDLESLRRLNVRRNLLVELPAGLNRLPLQRLDCSSNRISNLPPDIQHIDSLERLMLDHNPLTSPPAHICLKGLVHIMKYLRMESVKEDRKRGMLDASAELRPSRRRSAVLKQSQGEDLKFRDAPADRRKRQMVDSGYSTTDSMDKARWSPSEPEDSLTQLSTLTGAAYPQSHPVVLMSTVSSDAEDASRLALRAAQNVKDKRQGREAFIQQRMDALSATPTAEGSTSPSPHTPPLSIAVTPSPGVNGAATPSPGPSSSDPFAGYELEPQGDLVDEFTRELQRQKSDYEAKKRRAEQLRMEREKEEEKERWRTSHNSPGNGMATNVMTTSTSSTSLGSSSSEPPEIYTRRVPVQTQSFRDDRRQNVVEPPHQFRRTVSASDQQYMGPHDRSFDMSREHSIQEEYHRNNGGDSRHSSTDSSPMADPQLSPRQPQYNQGLPGPQYGPPQHSPSYPHPGSSSTNPDDEYRQTHRLLIQQQRREALLVKKRLAVEQQRIHRHIQNKDAVLKWAQGQNTDVRQEEYSSPPGNSSAVTREIPIQILNGPRETQPSRESLQLQESGRSTPISQPAWSTPISQPGRSTPISQPGRSTPISQPTSGMNGTNLNRLPPNCQRLLEAASTELNNVCPGFTIRRNIHMAQEEMAHISVLRRIIEQRLKVTLPDDLPAALRDGVVLCHLANHLRPRSVSSIHVPSPAVPKLSVAKCRRNVESFLDTCRRMGVPQEEICAVRVVLEESGIVALSKTVQALVEVAAKPSLSTV